VLYILNALPGAIIPLTGGNLEVAPITWFQFRAVLGSRPWLSAVGHADTSVLISNLAGVSVPENRVSVPVLSPGDQHLLALYQGPRLPEGATTLPEGATLVPYLLTFEGI